MLGSAIMLTMQRALTKAVVVARTKVKAGKVEQRKVKKDKKSKVLKQKVMQGQTAAREQWEEWQLKVIGTAEEI